MANIDPLLGSLTRTSNFSPLQTAITQAEAARLQANYGAEGKALGGLNAQGSSLQQGNKNSLGYSQPYINTGVGALNKAYGLAGAMTPDQYANLMANDPTLNTLLKQGVRASDMSAAGKGKVFSGAHQLELQQLGQELTNKYIGDIYNRNAQLAQLGGQFSQQQAGQEYGLGAALGDVEANKGMTSAEAQLARGEIGANARIDSGKTSVAQSTVAGLADGQVAGGYNNGYNLPVAGGVGGQVAGGTSNTSGFDIFGKDRVGSGNNISGGGGGGGSGGGANTGQGGSSSSPWDRGIKPQQPGPGGSTGANTPRGQDTTGGGSLGSSTGGFSGLDGGRGNTIGGGSANSPSTGGSLPTPNLGWENPNNSVGNDPGSIFSGLGNAASNLGKTVGSNNMGGGNTGGFRTRTIGGHQSVLIPQSAAAQYGGHWGWQRMDDLKGMSTSSGGNRGAGGQTPVGPSASTSLPATGYASPLDSNRRGFLPGKVVRAPNGKIIPS